MVLFISSSCCRYQITSDAQSSGRQCPDLIHSIHIDNRYVSVGFVDYPTDYGAIVEWWP